MKERKKERKKEHYNMIRNSATLFSEKKTLLLSLQALLYFQVKLLFLQHVQYVFVSAHVGVSFCYCKHAVMSSIFECRVKKTASVDVQVQWKKPLRKVRSI